MQYSLDLIENASYLHHVHLGKFLTRIYVDLEHIWLFLSNLRESTEHPGNLKWMHLSLI